MTKPIDRGKLIALLRKLAPASKDVVVLIVDDDSDVREIVKDTVEGVGMKAATAVNGRSALQWLDKNPKPALILLDLMMPEVDGFEFLEKIREIEELNDVPVVVLTAKELSEAERNFLAERTLLVLSKSAQPIGALGAALAAIAERGRNAADHFKPSGH
jgi:CheY-like chemotaxis protein